MRDFLGGRAPLVLEGWDWLAEAQEATNAWGWAKEGVSAFLVLVLAAKAAAWAWRSLRADSVGAYVLRELSGGGVAWVPSLSRLETLKVSCKYFTAGPGGAPSVEEVMVCGEPVTHLLTDRQRRRLQRVVAAAVRRCRADELRRQEASVLEKTKKKVYRSA